MYSCRTAIPILLNERCSFLRLEQVQDLIWSGDTVTLRADPLVECFSFSTRIIQMGEIRMTMIKNDRFYSQYSIVTFIRLPRFPSPTGIAVITMASARSQRDRAASCCSCEIREKGDSPLKMYFSRIRKIISGTINQITEMAVSIVLPIKKVFGLVDSKVIVEIKDEKRKFQGRLIAVDEYLNLHLEETIEYLDNQRGRNLGTVVIRGNNILTIAPVI
jgi:small nuclear ribonucleoprotein (snRNP)-like protein